MQKAKEVIIEGKYISLNKNLCQDSKVTKVSTTNRMKFVCLQQKITTSCQHLKKPYLTGAAEKILLLPYTKFYKILHYKIECLLTSVNQQFQRISMHGVRVELFEAQAKSIGIPLKILQFPKCQPWKFTKM